jgi:signal transduction histidine kinase
MTDQEVRLEPMLDAGFNQRLLSAVTGLTEEMSRASSKDEVLALAATWVPHIVPADRASIAFPTDADHLAVHALEGNKAIPVGLSLPLTDTTTGTAFLEKRIVFTENTSVRPELDCKMLSSKGLMTCINAPMISQGQAIGTLNVAHSRQGVYSPEHQALLLHTAGVIAAQLNLLDRFFQTQERLEAMVADRTKELESQKARLQHALDREKELSGLQRQFVSMVSHEFRTPLSIIDGNAQRMIRRHDKLDADRLFKGLGKIRSSVSRLTELVEAVLGAARLEDGVIEFNPAPFDLGGAVNEVYRNYQELNPSHQLFVDTENLPGEVQVDGKLIRQVISNLVSNAVRYSPEGTRVWIVGTTSDDGSVAIAVRDEGPGIPLDELDKLFDRFYRASTSTGIVGTGIGLHIVKALVDLHHGRIDIDSTEGEGSTFTVYLPHQKDSSAAA